MKQVFNSSEVAHVWANQQQDAGRNSNDNFYFKGQTIYSYGSHFPIATIVGNDVLFTMRSYSNTTAKHIGRARAAVSHKNFIYCYDVPVNLKYATTEHENNLNRWKREIKALFNELGNKKIRDTQGRINGINSHIAKLQAYCTYFSLPIKDKELKDLLKIAGSEDFVSQARAAKDKLNAANERTMKQAIRAHEQYIDLWRKYDNEGIKNLSAKVKELCNFYNSQNYIGSVYTRLRFNTTHNRVETSKGVQIPAEIAKRAFIQLNGCMEGTCKDINVPVMDYTITETTKDYIKAGCHTIPKSDVNYIANLLNWVK
jgi:hypothetical protein